MPPLDKRVGKLEEDLQAAARQAQSIDRMPDRDLIALLIEEQGTDPTSEVVERALQHFNRTGELPGNAEREVR